MRQPTLGSDRPVSSRLLDEAVVALMIRPAEFKRMLAGVLLAIGISSLVHAQIGDNQSPDESRGVRIIDAPTPASPDMSTDTSAAAPPGTALPNAALPESPKVTPPPEAAPSNGTTTAPIPGAASEIGSPKTPTPMLSPAGDSAKSKMPPAPILTPPPETAVATPPAAPSQSETPELQASPPSQIVTVPQDTATPSSPPTARPATLGPDTAPSLPNPAPTKLLPTPGNGAATLQSRPDPSENPSTAASLEVLSKSIKVANSAELSVEILPGPEIDLDSKVFFRIATRKAGYLILFDVDSTGKLTQIYPNPISVMAKGARARSNFIRPGKPIQLPDPRDELSGFEFVASPPVGTAMIVALLCDRPVQIVDLPNVPPAVLGSPAAAELLSKFAGELRISDPNESDGLREAHWSMDVRFYAIK
jgi:Domain of unknown function (DUF4384)